MFKGRIVSCSNINGKVHSFQKDFDDYESYQDFIDRNPEYAPQTLTGSLWDPWRVLDWSQGTLDWPRRILAVDNWMIPTKTKYLPEGVDLEKYVNRRLEKRQTEFEKGEKKRSLERSKEYLQDYLIENPDDTEAKTDVEKIEKELKELVE